MSTAISKNVQLPSLFREEYHKEHKPFLQTWSFSFESFSFLVKASSKAPCGILTHLDRVVECR